MSAHTSAALSIAVCLLSTSINSVAADQTFADWMVIRADNGTDSVAATFADGTETILAVRCMAKTQQCFHLVRLHSKCEEGSTYPVLINAPSGAGSVTGTCGLSNGVPELFLSPFDDVRALMKGTGMIGIAIPMASGAFKAVRFSLKGSQQAIQAAEDMVSRGPRSSTTGSSKRGTVTF